MKKILIALVALVASGSYAASVTVAEAAKVYTFPGHGKIVTTAKAGTVLNVVSEYAGFYLVEANAAQNAEAGVTQVYVCLWNGVIPRDGNMIDPVIKEQDGVAYFYADRWARVTPNLNAEHLRVGFANGDKAKILGSKVWYYEVETTSGRGYVEAGKVTVK